MRVAVLGAWHLGAVVAAANASWGRTVAVWDRDRRTRDALSTGRAMVREPGLDELLQDAGARLNVTEDAESAIAGADTVVIAYDTPVNERDELDLSPIDEALELVVIHADPGCLIVVHSQVPVGFTRDRTSRVVTAQRDDLLVSVTPENLRLGEALLAFQEPGHLAIGADTPAAHAKSETFWGPCAADLVRTDPSTAEMSKHIINAVLATSTALGNELGTMSAAEGADPTQAALLAKRDARLARLPIVPGLPVGGGTLARDLRLAAEHLGPSSLAHAAVESGEKRIETITESLARSCGPIAILGLTYKTGTSATRRSAGVTLARNLAAKGLEVRVFDPSVADEANPLAGVSGVAIAQSLSAAIAGARTVAMTTAHRAWCDDDVIAGLDRTDCTIHDLVGVFQFDTIAWSRSRYRGPSDIAN